jgi:DNA-binding GntR family transcriptional regulator
LADDVASRAGQDSIGGANWRFHQAIHRAANSPRLLTLIKQAARVVASNFLKIFPEHEQHSPEEHEHLLDALETHDAARGRSIAECHVLKAGRSLAEYLDHQYPAKNG